MSTQHDPSGHTLAEEAYAAGAVEQDAERIPSHTVELRFTMHGESEHVHAFVRDQLVLELLARSDVTSGEYTVTEHE